MGSLNINALTLIMANVLLKTASISVMHASFDRSQVPISHQMKKPQSLRGIYANQRHFLA